MEFDFDRRQVAAMHVSHAVAMVRQLDDLARGRTELGKLAGLAALEAQLVNVRAVTYFLLANKSHKDDIHASDYLPSWVGVPDQQLQGRLDDYRDVASKHVAHLTWTRVTSLAEPDFDLTPMAEDLRGAFYEFRNQFTELNPDLVDLFPTQ